MKLLICILISTQLVGCGFFQKRSADLNPLCKAECPQELPALTKDTFGDADLKMIEWAGIYHRCREACQAGEKK